MPEVMTINQTAQVGVESTPGTPPGSGANKLLTGLAVQIDPDFATTQYAASGQRFDSVSVPSMEASKLKGDGPLTYTEKVYLASGLYGPATITTPAGAVAARKWLFAPSLTGIIAQSTYQIQQGSSVRARQVNYGTWTDCTDSNTRKECKVSAAGFAQQIQDGITLTATPTAVPLIPVQPKDWSICLDTSSASLGSTKLARCFAANFGYTGAANSIWPMDRSLASFGATVNTKPKLAVDLSLMADASTAALWTEARAAQKLYLRYEAISTLLVDNLQTVTISGTPTGGTFTLTYKGQTTAGIAYNAIASAVQTALAALSTIGTGNVSVTGGPGPATPYVVAMTGSLANDTTAMTASAAGLTGGTPAIAVVQSSVPYSFVRDVCCVPVPNPFSDDNGAYVQQWLLMVVSDPNWTAGSASGTAFIETYVNNLTAL